MFLDPLVRGTDPDPDPDLSLSHKDVERTEVMLAKEKILKQNICKKKLFNYKKKKFV